MAANIRALWERVLDRPDALHGRLRRDCGGWRHAAEAKLR